MIDPAWLQIAAGLALVIGGALQIERDEEEESESWGYQVTDGGVCDGGEPEWEEE